MDDVQLYLTPEEIEHLWPTLPDDIRNRWQSSVVEETQTSFETSNELNDRLDKLSKDTSPEMESLREQLVQGLKAGKQPSQIQWKEIPDATILQLLHGVGACGVSAFIEMAMQEQNLTDQTMVSVASLSVVRHHMLEANAKAAVR